LAGSNAGLQVLVIDLLRLASFSPHESDPLNWLFTTFNPNKNVQVASLLRAVIERIIRNVAETITS